MFFQEISTQFYVFLAKLNSTLCFFCLNSTQQFSTLVFFWFHSQGPNNLNLSKQITTYPIFNNQSFLIDYEIMNYRSLITAINSSISSVLNIMSFQQLETNCKDIIMEMTKPQCNKMVEWFYMEVQRIFHLGEKGIEYNFSTRIYNQDDQTYMNEFFIEFIE